MKVTSTTVAEPVKFTPIAITVTIESQEEYEALCEMAWHTESIPSLPGILHKPHVEQFLEELHLMLKRNAQ
jgi:hypothetical protein